MTSTPRGLSEFFTFVSLSDASLGSLSNYKGKKAIGLDWQNNNFARASHFLISFFIEDGNTRQLFSFSFVTLDIVLYLPTTN